MNVLELTAVLRAIHHFQESLQSGVLLVQTDNTTVQSYLNRWGGGTRSQSPPVSPGDHSVVSGQFHYDSSSSPVRGRQCRSRHSISSSLESPREIGQFSGVVSQPGNSQSALQVWGSPTADLFATAANAKVPVFFSRTAGPSACCGDAFQADWSRDLLYMYPPIPLLHLALHKIRERKRKWSPYCRGGQEEGGSRWS